MYKIEDGILYITLVEQTMDDYKTCLEMNNECRTLEISSNKPFEIKHIPRNIKKIIIYGFVLNITNLPYHIEDIEYHIYSHSKIINLDYLPICLKKLRLLNYEDVHTELNYLPVNLILLDIVSFQNIDKIPCFENVSSLPPSLKSLLISSSKCDLNNLPLNLQYLKATTDNMSIINLPINLRTLILSFTSKPIIILPSTIQTLYLHNVYRQSYMINNWPTRLEKLTLFGPITKESIPSNLEYLEVNNYILDSKTKYYLENYKNIRFIENN